ncbi:MAG: hypothetical protein HDQ44_04170, partial [Desulfovibrio sp.]|nr:hypothetical protein [Desulfovibrio sp.]
MTTRNLRRLMCFLVICAGALFQAAVGNAAEEQAPTARHVFALLPLSIFENTTTGLDETGRQALLQQGSSQSWEIAGETQDVLVLAELPFRERAVAVRLFRNEEDASTEVAIGTLGEPVCTVELWHLEGSGRLYPVDTPPEPSIGEFFSKKRKPPLSQQNSVLICLGLGGLWARPVFWSEYGIHEPVVDR